MSADFIEPSESDAAVFVDEHGNPINVKASDIKAGFTLAGKLYMTTAAGTFRMLTPEEAREFRHEVETE